VNAALRPACVSVGGYSIYISVVFVANFAGDATFQHECILSLKLCILFSSVPHIQLLITSL